MSVSGNLARLSPTADWQRLPVGRESKPSRSAEDASGTDQRGGSVGLGRGGGRRHYLDSPYNQATSGWQYLEEFAPTGACPFLQ